MSNTSEDHGTDFTFIPVPLATGNTFKVPGGVVAQEVAHVRITITCADGSVSMAELQRSGTGWWLDADRFIAVEDHS